MATASPSSAMYCGTEASTCWKNWDLKLSDMVNINIAEVYDGSGAICYYNTTQ